MIYHLILYMFNRIQIRINLNITEKMGLQLTTNKGIITYEALPIFFNLNTDFYLSSLILHCGIGLFCSFFLIMSIYKFTHRVKARSEKSYIKTVEFKEIEEGQQDYNEDQYTEIGQDDKEDTEMIFRFDDFESSQKQTQFPNKKDYAQYFEEETFEALKFLEIQRSFLIFSPFLFVFILSNNLFQMDATINICFFLSIILYIIYKSGLKFNDGYQSQIGSPNYLTPKQVAIKQIKKYFKSRQTIKWMNILLENIFLLPILYTSIKMLRGNQTID